MVKENCPLTFEYKQSGCELEIAIAKQACIKRHNWKCDNVFYIRVNFAVKAYSCKSYKRLQL